MAKTCEKKTFEQYTETFRENNTKIPQLMMSLTSQDVIIQDDNSNNGDDIINNGMTAATTWMTPMKMTKNATFLTTTTVMSLYQTG